MQDQMAEVPFLVHSTHSHQGFEQEQQAFDPNQHQDLWEDAIEGSRCHTTAENIELFEKDRYVFEHNHKQCLVEFEVDLEVEHEIPIVVELQDHEDNSLGQLRDLMVFQGSAQG